MTGDDDVSLRAIGQVAVPVADLDTALPFYRDSLGLPFLFRAPGMAFLQCGETRIMLAVPEDEEFDHPSSILYFEVADLEASVRELDGRGVPFVGEPHKVADLPGGELWMAFFRDPADNLMALMSQRPAQA